MASKWKHGRRAAVPFAAKATIAALALFGLHESNVLYPSAAGLPDDALAKGGSDGRHLLSTNDTSSLSCAKEVQGTKADGTLECCQVTGGVLSLAGAMSGQSTCPDANGVGVCEKGTCCGSTDNVGGVILYTLIMLYMFLGLAIICDDYFCESLDIISDELGLSDDVAGATFMAAGSSAPELFTAVVTVLVTGGSEGLGAIVGSAVFNIMVICGITAKCAGGSLVIWWYPLTRDAIVYSISVIALLVVLLDYKVTVFESAFLIMCYGLYIFLMVKNAAIVKWIKQRGEVTKVEPIKVAGAIAAIQGKYDKENKEKYEANQMNPILKPVFHKAHNADKEQKREQQRRRVSNVAGTAIIVNRMKGKVAQARERLLLKMKTNGAGNAEAEKPTPSSPDSPSVESGAVSGDEVVAVNGPSIDVHENTESGGNKDGDDETESALDKVLAVLSVPLEIAMAWTTPDCREEKYRKYYMLSFTMSIVWIGILSFFMVDFGARAGCVMGVPSILMGLIVIAAGTSVPDALSSINVAKNGQGDMAVANVLGSNVFNIFLGLGLPWLIRCLTHGEVLLNRKEGVILPIIILLFYTVVFVGIIWYNGWRLSNKAGDAMLLAHAVFLVWNMLNMLPAEEPIIAFRIDPN